MEKLTKEQVENLTFEQMEVLIPKVRDHGSLEDKRIVAHVGAGGFFRDGFTPEQIKILQDLSNVDCVDCEGCFFCIDCKGCTGCKDCVGCTGCKLCIGCKLCVGCVLCDHLESRMYYTDNKPNTTKQNHKDNCLSCCDCLKRKAKTLFDLFTQEMELNISLSSKFDETQKIKRSLKKIRKLKFQTYEEFLKIKENINIKKRESEIQETRLNVVRALSENLI